MPYANYSPDQVVARGEALYEREIRSRVPSGNDGKFLAVDIESGEFDFDVDELLATKRLLSRQPNAVICGIRIGRAFVDRIGGFSARQRNG